MHHEHSSDETAHPPTGETAQQSLNTPGRSGSRDPNRIIDLRIRFAGLCMFVAGKQGDVMNVLLPPTDSTHRPALFWRGNPAGVDIDNLTLNIGGGVGRRPKMDLGSVFDVTGYPAGGCAPSDRTVAVPNADAVSTLKLHAGCGRVVNPGATWTLPGGLLGRMPTVLDWWIRGIPLSAALGSISVETSLPEDHPLADVERSLAGAEAGGKLDLWLLHVMPSDADPRGISSKPRLQAGGPPATGHHFAHYFKLLVCKEDPGHPAWPAIGPDPGDQEPPEWPGAATTLVEPKAAMGMLVDCMLAQARPA